MERLSREDVQFVWRHAWTYADRARLADDPLPEEYATWYVDHFAVAACDLCELPGHPRAWPDWLHEVMLRRRVA